MFDHFDWSQIALFSGDFADFKHYEDVINTILAVICVLSAGLAAGLTMGLLSLDVTKLEIKSMTGSEVDRADAEAILPIVKKHHLLLVTLLLFNSMANEALPVFLSALLPEWLSVLISVTLVLVFGEILPSAFFTGKAQLHTAAIMIPFVKTLTILFWPIGYPLSRCLDYAFGVEEETSVITRAELGALVYLQNNDRTRRRDKADVMELLKLKSSPKSERMPNLKHSTSKDSFISESSDGSEGGLSTYEVNIMTGILKLAKLQVKNSMIKIKSVYMISDSTRLDTGTLERLWNCGFSRIPVFKRRDKQHIIGYLLIKSLILVSADDRVPVETLPIRQPFFVKPGLRLLEMLSMFKEGRCHMALVTEDPIEAMRCMAEGKRPSSERSSVIGIVTLEDVIEEIIQGEITDETDAMPSNIPNGGTSWPGGTRAMGIHSMGRSSMMQKTSSNRALIKKSEDKRLVKRSVSYATNYSGPGSYRRVQDPSVEHTPSEDAARRDWHQRAVTHAHAHTHKHPQSSSESMTYAYPNRRLSETKGILNRYGGQHAHMHEHSDYSYGGVDFNDNDVDDGFQLSDYTESPANNSPSTATSPSAFKTSTSKEKEKHPKSFNNGEELDSYQSGAEGFRITKSTSVVSLFESIVDSSDAPEGGGDVNSQSELIKFISF